MMHSCREDSDLFNRMKLAGFTFIQPWNSLVYHLTGRGAGSFDGDPIRHEQWKKDMNNSTKEFIRKWGSNVKHTDLMEPIVTPKYDIGFIVKNCNDQALEILELWCNNIYVDCEIGDYINREQPNTKFSLKDRIRSSTYGDPEKQNDILIEFDLTQLNQNSFNLLQQIPEIIQQSGDIGKFQLDIFNITIKSLQTYENNLIVNRSL